MEIKGVLVGCSHLKVETPRNRRKDMIEKEPIANLPISCMADDYEIACRNCCNFLSLVS